MPFRVRSVVFIVVGIGLIVGLGVGGFYWYQRNQKPQSSQSSLKRAFPQIDIFSVVTHNQTISQKPNTPPYNALSGVMRQETVAPSYNFDALVEDSGGTSIFPLSGSSVRHGPIYREYLGVIAPVSLGELGRQDQIYLTYYANFEKGVVMGVIERLDESRNGTVLHLLDDPDDTGYRVSEEMAFAVYDPSQYFDLGSAATGVSLKPGDIVWGEFTPGIGSSGSIVALSSLTLRTPPYQTLRGTVFNVEAISDSAVNFRLNSSPVIISANGGTIIFKHEPNLPLPGSEEWKKRNLGVRALRDGQQVSLFMYLAGDHWQALSIDIRSDVGQ